MKRSSCSIMMLCIAVTFVCVSDCITEKKSTPATHAKKSGADRKDRTKDRAQKESKSEKKQEKSYTKHAQGLPKDIWLSGNSIAYLIYTTTDEVIVVTWLDINRRTLDGRSKTPEEELFNRLMYFEAYSVYKISIPEDAVMRDFDSIKAENGLTQEQLENLFKEQLYSFQDGVEQRRMMYAISTLLGQFVAGRIIITQEEIKKYYDDVVSGVIQGPLSVVEKESFKIKRAFIPAGTFTDEELQELAEKQFYIGLLDWKMPYWIATDEIADEKSFIKRMRKDDIYVEKNNGGHEVFMVIKYSPERVKSLEDMNKNITQLLTEEKQKTVMEEYKKELFSRYTIIQL